MSQFDFQIVHTQGKKHGNADGLSQIPLSEMPCDCYTAGVKLESLPCYPCHYCAKVHSQWEGFKDDDVPLAVKNPVGSVRHIQLEDDDQSSKLDLTSLSQPTENADVDVENTSQSKGDSYAITNSNWIAQYSSQERRERQEQDSNLEPIINGCHKIQNQFPMSCTYSVLLSSIYGCVKISYNSRIMFYSIVGMTRLIISWYWLCQSL